MTDAVESLTEYLRRARRIAVLTGAGISTESGIPDFRSTSGLYRTVTSEEVFDIGFFDARPEEFYRVIGPMYRTILAAEPNAGHRALARLERLGKSVSIATQNIDALHRKAGSSSVFEVHGSMATLTCRECGRLFDSDRFESALSAGEVLRCPCGGVLKPDITFFGEGLPHDAFLAATIAFESADLALALGTSLAVYPAASLPQNRKSGVPLLIVNKTPTPLDGAAALVIHAPLGETLEKAVDRLE